MESQPVDSFKYLPVLARVFEAAEMSTIMVTNMPYWAEKIGVPRTLAVEFPFGHILGQPHNREQQMRVIGQALEVLEKAEAPASQDDRSHVSGCRTAGKAQSCSDRGVRRQTSFGCDSADWRRRAKWVVLTRLNGTMMRSQSHV